MNARKGASVGPAYRCPTTTGAMDRDGATLLDEYWEALLARSEDSARLRREIQHQPALAEALELLHDLHRLRSEVKRLEITDPSPGS